MNSGGFGGTLATYPPPRHACHRHAEHVPVEGTNPYHQRRGRQASGQDAPTIRRWYDQGKLSGELIGRRLWIDWPPRPGTPRVTAGPSVPSVTTEEAARRLSKARASVHRLHEADRLRGERIGIQLWITESH